MKKIIALLLAAIMVLGLAACASKTETTEASDVKNVVYIVNGNLGDKSFFDSAQAGIDELVKAGRITCKTIELGGTDEDQPKWLSTLYDVSQSGEYDLVICGTYQMPDYLKEVATKYPDQLYLIFDDNTYAGENSNVVNITYKQNDMGYLVGTFAACMTTDTSVANINEDAVIGFVGGVDSPVINDFLIGFIEGAQSVNPDIKVDTRYTNDYVDTAIAKEFGYSMINDKKCDIIWGVAGNAGNGAAEAALDTGKAWFIGVDSDQELTFSSDLAALTLTSGLKNIGNSIIWIFDQWDAGKTYWGSEVQLGLAEGGVGIVTDKNYDKYASAETKAAVEAAQKGITDGSIKVDSAPGKGTTITVTIYLKLQESEKEQEKELFDLPVLVVDDDKTCCESTVATLKDIGIAGEWVLTGREAVERCYARHEAGCDYFAVILDWKMPKMDGIETARKIRERVGKDVTIIILTSFEFSEIEEEARAAGVDAFIAKPLFRSRLTATLRQFTSGKKEKNARSLLESFAKTDYTSKRVLLVEDNELNREIAAEILGMTGVAVDIAENGKIAVEKVVAAPEKWYDLIFMDIQMPIMNGYEATAAIRSLPGGRGKVPIIAMTANAFAEDVQLAKNTGMNEHIAKPLELDKLNDVLKQWLQ